MAINKTAVFLASRFEEFSELRELVKRKITDWQLKLLTAIDLNDGNVSHRPPLAECLGYVRRAEFMILLLGDTYGGVAPKSDKSFTHLEYEEAIREDSNTRVLVFCIGESYQNRRITYSSDPQLASWQRQVEENHTLGYFDPNTPLELMAQEIFNQLLAALYEMRYGALSVDTEDSEELILAIADESLIDNSEINYMEEREAQIRGVSLVEDRAKFSTMLEAITQPMAVAAFEHKEEAQRAINIREHGIAIQHLKRALEHRPLDLMANYWLAQLYLAQGNKKRCIKAIDLAERAANIAELDGGKIRAAGAYMIAARAAHISNLEGGGLKYAQKALELAPHYSRVHIEMARQYVLSNDNDAALREIEESIRQYPRSLRDVLGDPTFKPLRKNIHKVVWQIKEEVIRDVQDLLACEGKLCGIFGINYQLVALDSQHSLFQLYDIGRQSVRRQLSLLTESVTKANQLSVECIASDVEIEPPAKSEIFRIGNSNAIQIVSFLKQPNDVIKVGEPIFAFRYSKSGTTGNWLWTGDFSIQLTKYFVTVGDSVPLDSPNIFEYMPSKEPVKANGRAQEIKLKILEAEQAIELNKRAKEVAIGESLGAMVTGLILSSNNRGSAVGNTRTENLGIATYEKEIEMAAADILNLNLELNTLLTECSATQKISCDALAIFEEVCLRKGSWMLPFSSVYSCQKNDLIRLKIGQLDELKERLNRDIEITEELPEWLSSTSKQTRKPLFSLCRVVSVSNEKLVLSRIGAYLN